MVLISHELHDTQCNVLLCLYIDIMYINGMPFLTTISKNVKHHTAMWVADCTAPTIASLVESVLKLYSRASFQMTEVCADHKFKPVLHILQDGGWSFMTNLANAQEHVPEAKCNNHVLKEYIHATYHGIPYKILPRTIICNMVMETVTGFYPSPKSVWSCTHVNSCQKYTLYIYQSTYFIEYFMQNNFKYPRIKKIHQILEKITRID